VDPRGHGNGADHTLWDDAQEGFIHNAGSASAILNIDRTHRFWREG